MRGGILVLKSWKKYSNKSRFLDNPHCHFHVNLHHRIRLEGCVHRQSEVGRKDHPQ